MERTGITPNSCGKGDGVMSDTLNKKEIDQLMDLFDKIKLDLSATSFPTRTNRLEAVENMKKVLGIHGYKLTGEEA
jgi:hypothetical protein